MRHDDPPRAKTTVIAIGTALLVLLALLSAPVTAQDSSDEAIRVTIGVLAYAGKERAVARWQPTADYLTQANPGHVFRVRPLYLSELRKAFVEGELDFVLTQSLQFSELGRLGRIWPLATLVVKGDGAGLERLGAVIFTRQGTGFQSVGDLVGSRVAGASPNALGGWILGMQALENAGIDVENEITPIFTGLPLEAVIDAVLEGRAHAGVVRSSFFHRYLAEYPDSRLVPVGDARRVGFPYPSNTPLVPEWPFAATGKAPEELVTRVAQQLLAVESDSPAAEQARILGWRTPLDYSIVDRLRDKWLPEPLTLTGIVRGYWPALLLIALLVLMLFHWQSRGTTAKLAAAKRRLHRAFSGLHTGTVLLDEQGTILLANQAVSRFSRLPDADETSLVGQRFCDAFELRMDQVDSDCVLPVLTRMATEPGNRAVDGVIDRDHQRYDVNLRVSQLEAEGRPQLLVSMLDITDLRSAHALLTYRATHDRLTGLLNRAALEEFLSQVVANRTGTVADPGSSCLVWVDLDEFRLLNEIGTRTLGDRILASLASHFSLELPPDAKIARMGVDEFAIWMPLGSHDTCTVVARDVLETVHAFRLPDEHTHLRLRASVGVTRIESNDLLASKRLDDAERACQSAQRLGGDRVIQYSGEDTELLERGKQIERYNALRAAIANDRLSQAGQCIVPLNRDHAPLYEVLLRVAGEDGQLRFPSEFIEIAEKYHAMGEVDRWVVNSTCQWLSNRSGPPLVASINLSAHSVQDPEMIPFIREALYDHEVDPTQIIFEITETAAILNLEQAERLIAALRRLGCRFSLDDFGGGFLSFEFLRRLQPDFVKIDGHLIKDMINDPVANVIVSAIIEVSRVMNARTVAEWIETQEQFDRVRAMGIDYVQGFLTHRPEAVDNL